MNFEKLVESFNQTIDFQSFLINILVATFLSLILRFFYVRFGNAIANRRKFSTNFIPLALTTMLIITILKSSIALSLGLVGALSIVRFRAAIKDPEELIYLFLVISIGLGTGANYPILVCVAMLIILTLLYLNYRITQSQTYTKDNLMYVNITSSSTDVNKFIDVLKAHMSFVELKRMDRDSQRIDMTFACKADDLTAITNTQDQIISTIPDTTISIVDQPDLIV